MYVAASVTLLIPRVRERQRLFGGGYQNHKHETDVRLYELAQKAIKALAEGTGEHSPARKWAVILEEMREEAFRQGPNDREQGAEEQREGSQDAIGSPDEQILEDALRAHWEADIARGALVNRSLYSDTPAECAPSIAARLWDKWKTTDWLDLDSAVRVTVVCFGSMTDSARLLVRLPHLRRRMFPSRQPTPEYRTQP
jgi:hypothetical protein